MKMFGHHKREFFTLKARLNFVVNGQHDKITPEAKEKSAPFRFINGTFFGVFGVLGSNFHSNRGIISPNVKSKVYF